MTYKTAIATPKSRAIRPCRQTRIHTHEGREMSTRRLGGPREVGVVNKKHRLGLGRVLIIVRVIYKIAIYCGQVLIVLIRRGNRRRRSTVIQRLVQKGGFKPFFILFPRRQVLSAMVLCKKWLINGQRYLDFYFQENRALPTTVRQSINSLTVESFNLHYHGLHYS